MAINKGTDYSAFIQESFAKVESAFHDISRLNSFTFDEGEIRVCDVFPIYPTDELDINVDYIIDTLPLVVKPFARFTVEIEYYMQYNRDLWKGWQAMITKGRSGNLSMKVPRVNLSTPYYNNATDAEGADTTKKRYYTSSSSLAQDIGVPAIAYNTDKPYLQSYAASEKTDIAYRHLYDNGQVNALPFMFYQQVFKYYKLNQNLTQSNTNWFPIEGDYDWLLPFAAGDNSNILDVEGNNPLYYCEVPSNNPLDGVNLLQLRYAQKRIDRFTGALPWLMRGNVPTMDTSFRSDNNVLISLNEGYATIPDGTVSDGLDWNVDANGDLQPTFGSSSALVAPGSLSGFIGNIFGDFTTGINANQLRSLLALTVWQERNAYTNGSYNQFVKAHFRVNPNADEHIPMYIGGTTTDMYFDSVLQTAVDNSESDATPVGTQRSNGLARSNGYIGHVSSHDFGFVMGIITIRPDNMYTQGLEHFLNQENVMTDYFFPEFAALSPEPVRNSELFISGDKTIDDDLFGYSRRWSHLIARSNRVGGLFALPSETDSLFSAYTQAFEFPETPSLSNQFVTLSPENVRRDMFAYFNQPMFKIQLASRVSGRRPIPYDVRPNTFGF